ncbi:kinase-like domain-containing protein, partial [Chaetomium tenue]
MDEGVSYYCPGGFHPVLIGDVLDGRFKVVNKLGFGPEATVWLCRHVRWDEWRAIKIYAAESSHENLASAKVQETLHLSPSLDHFWVVGPNGRHLCAVQRLLGPLVSEVACQFPERPLFLRDICRQMATAVSSLHKQGFYHGRLHPGNIRFVVNDAIRRLTEQEMKEMIGRPYICHDPAHPSNKYANRPPSTHIPEYLVSPTELGFPTGRLGGYDRGSYTTPFIALADLDAYTQHPPNTTN